MRSLDHLVNRLIRNFVTEVVEHARQVGDPEVGSRLSGLLTKLFPRVPENWVRYARSLRTWSDEERVLITLEKAALGTSDNPEILQEMVGSNLRLGRVGDARALLERFKSDVGGWSDLALARICAQERDWEASQDALNSALDKVLPEDRPDFMISGGVLLALTAERRALATEMLEMALGEKEDLFARVLLAVLLKDTAPIASESHLAVARSLWGGSDSAFLQYVTDMGWSDSKS